MHHVIVCMPLSKETKRQREKNEVETARSCQDNRTIADHGSWWGRGEGGRMTLVPATAGLRFKSQELLGGAEEREEHGVGVVCFVLLRSATFRKWIPGEADRKAWISVSPTVLRQYLADNQLRENYIQIWVCFSCFVLLFVSY